MSNVRVEHGRKMAQDTGLIDVLADLMAYAEAEGLDFPAALEAAQDLFILDEFAE